MLWGAWFFLAGIIAVTDARAQSPIKIVLDGPGVYAVSRAELAQAWNVDSEAVDGNLELRHGETPIAAWLDGDSRSWSELVFAVPTHLFEGPDLRDPSPLLALKVERAEISLPVLPPVGQKSTTQAVRHRILLEEDRVRVTPVTKDVVLGGLDTLWYWAVVSRRQSARLTVDLDPFEDLRPGRLESLELRVRLLGWTHPELPESIPQHQVDVFLNGHQVGSGTWNGRRLYTLRVPSIDAGLLRAQDNVLEVVVPQRGLPPDSPDAEPAEIIDLSYVDRVEILYDAEPRVGSGGAKSVLPRDGLPTVEGARVLQAWDPPSPSAEAEAFLIRDDPWQRPLQVTTWRPAPPALPPVDYVAIGPESLLAGVEPLLTWHRGRGLRTASVAVEDLYDTYGDGLRKVSGLRDFLLAEHGRHGALKYVLLVGDADWLMIDERPVGMAPEQERETHLVPAETYVSPYGPAVSDHLIAVAADDETRPRFAVGRLPVSTSEELAAVVAKLLKAYGAPPPETAELLLVAGLDGPSQGRMRRLARNLEHTILPRASDSLVLHRLLLRRASEDGDGPSLGEQVADGFQRAPALIYFSGHGSRHIWGLGGPDALGPTVRFDVEHLWAVAPPSRLPVVLSISCATAPFDHPSTGSMGEAMLLDPERGAVAFLGSSATVFTPARFSLELLDGFLVQGLTLGEALVEAKGAVDKAHFSHLYNLLGDPAFRLRP